MAVHKYDATNDKWISDTGTTPASGAAAELRLTSGWTRHTQVLRSCDNPSASRRPQASHVPPAAGTYTSNIFDGLKVICGLMVLACVALFFLILA